MHLSDRLTDRGGAYWHLLGVLHSLVEAGHDVRLVVGRDEGQIAAPCAVDVVPALASRTAAEAPGLDAIVSRFAPDLIHVHTVMNPAALEWAAAGKAVITVQDHRYFCPTRGKWTSAGSVCLEPMSPEICTACFEDEAYFREVYALTAARLSAIRRMQVVVLSHYMKAELVRAGVPQAQIAVIPPFVHGLDVAAPPDGPPCVLFVGRLAATKGAMEALEAWRRSGLDLPFVVAGTGPLRADLESAGATVLGWLNHQRLSSVYRSARVLVMPSRWQEPFGIAGLEALTMGAAVAAWRSGGVLEWHPGPGLVAWGDVPGLAAALREVAGRGAAPPAGYERAPLMGRLAAVYEKAGTFSPARGNG